MGRIPINALVQDRFLEQQVVCRRADGSNVGLCGGKEIVKLVGFILVCGSQTVVGRLQNAFIQLLDEEGVVLLGSIVNIKTQPGDRQKSDEQISQDQAGAQVEGIDGGGQL